MGMISSSVKEYVEQNDVKSIRVALTTLGYIADYDSFRRFEDSTEYAREKIESLFQEDDKQPYDTSSTVKSYRAIIKLMMSNFSEEKYDAAVRIGTSLFTETTEESVQSSTETREEAATEESFFSKMTQRPKRIVLAIIAVIAIIAVVINLLK